MITGQSIGAIEMRTRLEDVEARVAILERAASHGMALYMLRLIDGDGAATPVAASNIQPDNPAVAVDKLRRGEIAWVRQGDERAVACSLGLGTWRLGVSPG